MFVNYRESNVKEGALRNEKRSFFLVIKGKYEMPVLSYPITVYMNGFFNHDAAQNGQKSNRLT